MTSHSFFSFLITEMNDRFKYHSISAYGAQLSYFFLLSIFPFLIFLISVLSLFSMSYEGAVDLLSKVAPKEVIIIINDYVENLLPKKSINVLSISFLGTIWAASRGLNILISSLNRSYGIAQKRNFFKKRILAMFFTILVAIAIIFVLTIPNIGMDFLLWVSKFVGLTNFFIRIWYYVRWTIVAFILFLVIGSLYYIAPNTKLKFAEIIPGTFFALFGWILISLGFSFFINNFSNFTIIYGSLTAVIVLMVWLYLSGIILIIGGEINSIFLIYKNLNKEQMAKE